MFCKHNWQVLSEVTTKSKLELMNENNVDWKAHDSNGVIVATKRKYIQTLTCTKCGKLNRFVEDI